MRDAVVEVNGLTVKFDDFTAVDNISFTVNRGEIFGFLGANGAGKTTTIRVLCGLLQPTGGSVSVAGVDAVDGGRAIKSRVGYMSQKFTLYNDMTVEENLTFIASLRRLTKADYFKQRRDLFDFIAFDRPLKTLVRDLPGGTKQKVSLAAALLHNPDIVFLDEPTAGVSPEARSSFWALIRRLSGGGKTVFVTTHYMDEAEQCNRIALMREGRIIALDTPGGLKSSTFPMPVLEFEPKGAMSFARFAAIKRQELFLFFEPYGIRFHACVRNGEEWEKVRSTYEETFSIREITPTLEDVFIRREEVERV